VRARALSYGPRVVSEWAVAGTGKGVGNRLEVRKPHDSSGCRDAEEHQRHSHEDLELGERVRLLRRSAEVEPVEQPQQGQPAEARPPRDADEAQVGVWMRKVCQYPPGTSHPSWPRRAICRLHSL